VRRALSPGLTTFLVVDVILVLTFLVLLVMSLANQGAGASPAAAVSPSASAEPETEPDQSAPAEPEQTAALTDFVLPSGNIYCSMTETTATCTILSFSYAAPPLPEGCTGTVGNVLNITAGAQATFPCVESPPTGPAEGTPVLDYGEGSTIGEMTCLSSTNGVFCRHDPSGKGFSLARAGTQFF
jgi:hypothetical protein